MKPQKLSQRSNIHYEHNFTQTKNLRPSVPQLIVCSISGDPYHLHKSDKYSSSGYFIFTSSDTVASILFKSYIHIANKISLEFGEQFSESKQFFAAGINKLRIMILFKVHSYDVLHKHDKGSTGSFTTLQIYNTFRLQSTCQSLLSVCQMPIFIFVT